MIICILFRWSRTENQIHVGSTPPPNADLRIGESRVGLGLKWLRNRNIGTKNKLYTILKLIISMILKSLILMFIYHH